MPESKAQEAVRLEQYAPDTFAISTERCPQTFQILGDRTITVLDSNLHLLSFGCIVEFGSRSHASIDEISSGNETVG
jgi:hypothetical protein